MRVMVIVKASKDSEAGIMPSTELLSAMGKFNEAMVKAGVMLAGEGLHPSSNGVRIRYSGRERAVTHGPFGGTGDLVSGFWLIQVKSRGEAIEWASRCPGSDNAVVEVRQVMEFSEFPAEMKALAAEFPEMPAQPGKERKVVTPS